MNRTVYAECNGREFEHGVVSFERTDECETKVDIKCHASIIRNQQEEFFDELQSVIQKYAI